MSDAELAPQFYSKILNKGLDLPISGLPDQTVIHNSATPRTVALLGIDFLGLRPAVQVTEGEQVCQGQTLFTHKDYPEIHYTAPGSGTITAINRGAHRVLQSVVIELHEMGDGYTDEEATSHFAVYNREHLPKLTRQQVQKQLLDSGLWVALRTRPYSKVPVPDTSPHSIFITALDTNPLAVRPEVVIATQPEAFEDGLNVLSHLTDGPLFLCKAQSTPIPASNKHITNLKVAEFAGPHPAGLPGTHIHFLDPVHTNKTVWHLGYQDVIAIGKLFTTGKLWVERIIALGGPMVKTPRLLRTRLGANVMDLVAGELRAGDARVISGSVWSGHRAMATWAQYLGRYHNQISVIREERVRRLFGWLDPSGDRYSHHNVLNSCLQRSHKLFDLTTALQGSLRPFLPTTSLSRVMPLDILPALLLRSLIVGDTDMAQNLGCLELAEEDLALCTYVCPSKYEYGAALRAALTQIEKVG